MEIYYADGESGVISLLNTTWALDENKAIVGMNVKHPTKETSSSG